ncbi:serine protease easter isoform X1 [Drosophila nasuta]|uniref:serine protease easter isoform X1 n=1 Tax=Drosophila nasuta TaxID=42062 RepID=UPI00295F4B7F|nr:serine protease easter isoform X1 [Drosophila nasuta]
MTPISLLFVVVVFSLATLWQLLLAAPNPDSRAAQTHYGNCYTADFGHGRCLLRSNCDFYDTNVLDATSKRHCNSQQRPNLVCCPREKNALPLVAPRIDNNTKLSTSEVTAAASHVAGNFNGDQLPKHPNCGTSFAFKVYGGNNTGLNEFPWTTLLEYTVQATGQTQRICGASFIAGRWLLTAAHCVHQSFLGSGRKLSGARLGEWNQTSNPDCITNWNGRRECAPPFIQASFDRTIIHPQFELENWTNDIALLRLTSAVDWSQHHPLEPVCLPPSSGAGGAAGSDQLEGSAVDVSGWGLTEKNNEPSAVKRKAVLLVQSQSQCQATYRNEGYSIIDSQICASGGRNVDSCSGDSGGPLTLETYTADRNLYVYQAGIVSYGKKRCGQANFPGVYTRVSSFMDWIEQTIRNNSDG